jgi:septation ring formation regulator
MAYFIGFFILLVALYIVGYLMKKKYYREMDRLEAWKIDLSNRPIPDEMSKVKQLNMTGQTEELFERWRNEWDDVVTVKLPNLEEYLFDAEEFTDRYRFKKAKAVQQEIAKKLHETEIQIKNILEELHELVGSEEKNRVEIEELKEVYRETKKQLLAHRHTFGKAEKSLEDGLKIIAGKFQEFAEKTESGNYLEAREVVLLIHSELGAIKDKMDLIPQLIIESQSMIPGQFATLREGYKEMVQTGYYLEHIEIDKEIGQLEEKLKGISRLIEEIEIEIADEQVKDIKDRLEVLFDFLEKEVESKHFVVKNEKITGETLAQVSKDYELLSEEVVHVQESYQVTDSDLEILRNLEKELATVYKQYGILVEKIKLNETAQSVISDELAEIKEQLDAILEEEQIFAQKLQALRKDELEARDKVKELTRKVSEAYRLIAKSNIPGLPNQYKYLLEDTNESIQNVIMQLEEKPLNVSALNQYLEIAVLTVEKLGTTTVELVENVLLAEKAIQYGNRYRSQYPSVAKGLTEAETLFRQFEYQEALEQAAATLEGIDPAALKKIKASVED